MNYSNRLLAAVSALTVALAIGLLIEHGIRHEYELLAREAPPAEDSLVQAKDLAAISTFRFRDDRTLDIIDDLGRHYSMVFTAPCPGLVGAAQFSLVTSSFRNMDQFVGIAVKGHVCTFKDFAPS